MDPRKLLYMKSVVDHGSFSKAARKLQVSQPALSTSMDRLEASMGVKLLERGPMGVVPTRRARCSIHVPGSSRTRSTSRDSRCRAQEAIDKEITAGAIVSVVANVIPWLFADGGKTIPIFRCGLSRVPTRSF